MQLATIDSVGNGKMQLAIIDSVGNGTMPLATKKKKR
jgi:hypothetical protein